MPQSIIIKKEAHDGINEIFGFYESNSEMRCHRDILRIVDQSIDKAFKAGVEAGLSQVKDLLNEMKQNAI